MNTSNVEGRPAGVKSERLEARINKEQKELLQRAAALLGRSVTDFVVASACEAAVRTLQEYEMIHLSDRDREVFVEALLNPPEPNQKLREAADRYNEHTGR